MPAFQRYLLFILIITLSACSSGLPDEVALAYEALPKKIDFNFHVRPILSDRCFSCHGPDENARKAELRLDLPETAFAKLASGEGFAFRAGKPQHSRAIERILSQDPERMMPPAESKLGMTEEEKAILIKWVEQGAEWKEHWAFLPPEAPELPEPEHADWPVANPIDRFVYQKLEENGLEPSPAAGKERLLRRVYLDLTGLPPGIEEMDAFLADEDPQAYERVVDRLLDSDANAERLALDWLDLSRYADSHGLHADGYRLMWPWRDWVINAFRQNMPYDQFVTWQLAGDLLPNATTEQKLATAFNRNHPMTAEGGAIDEEFRLNYVFDRAETVATAFMGLTLNCARCHDHKFDPISQKEYYSFTAFFNNVKELGMTGDDGNFGPMLLLPEPGTEEKLREIKAQIGTKETELEDQLATVTEIGDFIRDLPDDYQPPRPVGYFPLDQLQERGNGSIADGNENSVSPGVPKLQEGKFGKALAFTGNFDELHLKKVGVIELHEPFSAGLWLNNTKREKNRTQTLLGTSGNKNNFWRGWDFYLDEHNRLNARLIHSLPHNYVHVQTEDSIALNTWTHVAFTYDGSARAEGIHLYIDGREAAKVIRYDHLYKTIYPITNGAHVPDPNRAVRAAKSYRSFTGENGAFIGSLDEIRCYNSALTPLDIALLGAQLTVADIKQAPQQHRQLLLAHFRQSRPAVQQLQKELRQLQARKMEIMNPIEEVMVMEEMAHTRPMYVYSRGAYDAPTQRVSTDTPDKLPPFPDDLPRNRLGLARWLFQPDHPLTARVTVNRYWQMLFSRGLVNTPQDFGVQGSLPSHPALLDWLALEFQNSGWDVKALLRTIVLSNTYRQSSEPSQQAREKDPENLLLARAPSYRLPAEVIRDNALAAAGLLVPHLGGESVRPYQPEGLWIEKGTFSHILLTYKVTKGDSLYRRSLYTFVKRTSPHPYMTTFDAPPREVCIVKRENTNTPLQALILMNDPQFVEAARALAERMQLAGGEELNDQLVYAFRLVTGRHPKNQEVALFEELYQKQLSRFRDHPDEAKALLTVGEFRHVNDLDASNTAALAMVANTMLNHDEAYMKR
jgi:hypothetical protein